MSRSNAASGSLGALLGGFGLGAAFMRWAPLVEEDRMLIGALLIIPLFLALHTACLFVPPKTAWALCGTACVLGIIGAMA